MGHGGKYGYLWTSKPMLRIGGSSGITAKRSNVTQKGCLTRLYALMLNLAKIGTRKYCPTIQKT